MLQMQLRLDLVLLWLWCKLAAAAPIQSLAQERPHAAGVAIKKKKNNIKGVPAVAQQKQI